MKVFKRYTVNFITEHVCIRISAWRICATWTVYRNHLVSLSYYRFTMGPGVAQWLRHCTTSREVPGSIPGGVTGGFFPWFLPTKPCALGSTQLLKMSTRDFSWGKGGRFVRLTTYHQCSAESQDNPGLNLPGNPRTTSACCGRPLLLLFTIGLLLAAYE